MEEMKNIIVEPPQPPAWFLEFEKRFLKFQTEMLKFQEMVMARFDKQDEFNKYVIARLDYMDTHQPTWFKQ
jgi:hypothetical protein